MGKSYNTEWVIWLSRVGSGWRRCRYMPVDPIIIPLILTLVPWTDCAVFAASLDQMFLFCPRLTTVGQSEAQGFTCFHFLPPIQLHSGSKRCQCLPWPSEGESSEVSTSRTSWQIDAKPHGEANNHPQSRPHPQPIQSLNCCYSWPWDYTTPH